MQTFPATVVIRHRRENLKKCSLRGLEVRKDFIFTRYPEPNLPVLDDYILLALDAAPLTQADARLGLVILDGTWRYAERMYHNIPALTKLERRSLPSCLFTSYPRRQDDCQNPEQGLASIEAIYAAYTILGRSTEGILDLYHWKEKFLSCNFASLMPRNG